jgi:hypothetical protein
VVIDFADLIKFVHEGPPIAASASFTAINDEAIVNARHIS